MTCAYTRVVLYPKTALKNFFLLFWFTIISEPLFAQPVHRPEQFALIKIVTDSKNLLIGTTKLFSKNKGVFPWFNRKGQNDDLQYQTVIPHADYSHIVGVSNEYRRLSGLLVDLRKDIEKQYPANAVGLGTKLPDPDRVHSKAFQTWVYFAALKCLLPVEFLLESAQGFGPNKSTRLHIFETAELRGISPGKKGFGNLRNTTAQSLYSSFWHSSTRPHRSLRVSALSLNSLYNSREEIYSTKDDKGKTKKSFVSILETGIKDQIIKAEQMVPKTESPGSLWSIRSKHVDIPTHNAGAFDVEINLSAQEVLDARIQSLLGVMTSKNAKILSVIKTHLDVINARINLRLFDPKAVNLVNSQPFGNFEHDIANHSKKPKGLMEDLEFENFRKLSSNLVFGSEYLVGSNVVKTTSAETAFECLYLEKIVLPTSLKIAETLAKEVVKTAPKLTLGFEEKMFSQIISTPCSTTSEPLKIPHVSGISTLNLIQYYLVSYFELSSAFESYLLGDSAPFIHQVAQSNLLLAQQTLQAFKPFTEKFFKAILSQNKITLNQDQDKLLTTRLQAHLDTLDSELTSLHKNGTHNEFLRRHWETTLCKISPSHCSSKKTSTENLLTQLEQQNNDRKLELIILRPMATSLIRIKKIDKILARSSSDIKLSQSGLPKDYLSAFEHSPRTRSSFLLNLEEIGTWIESKIAFVLGEDVLGLNAGKAGRPDGHWAKRLRGILENPRVMEAVQALVQSINTYSSMGIFDDETIIQAAIQESIEGLSNTKKFGQALNAKDQERGVQEKIQEKNSAIAKRDRTRLNSNQPRQIKDARVVDAEQFAEFLAFLGLSEFKPNPMAGLGWKNALKTANQRDGFFKLEAKLKAQQTDDPSKNEPAMPRWVASSLDLFIHKKIIENRLKKTHPILEIKTDQEDKTLLDLVYARLGSLNDSALVPLGIADMIRSTIRQNAASIRKTISHYASIAQNARPGDDQDPNLRLAFDAQNSYLSSITRQSLLGKLGLKVKEDPTLQEILNEETQEYVEKTRLDLRTNGEVFKEDYLHPTVTVAGLFFMAEIAFMAPGLVATATTAAELQSFRALLQGLGRMKSLGRVKEFLSGRLSTPKSLDFAKRLVLSGLHRTAIYSFGVDFGITTHYTFVGINHEFDKAFEFHRVIAMENNEDRSNGYRTAEILAAFKEKRQEAITSFLMGLVETSVMVVKPVVDDVIHLTGTAMRKANKSIRPKTLTQTVRSTEKGHIAPSNQINAQEKLEKFLGEQRITGGGGNQVPYEVKIPAIDPSEVNAYVKSAAKSSIFKRSADLFKNIFLYGRATLPEVQSFDLLNRLYIYRLAEIFKDQRTLGLLLEDYSVFLKGRIIKNSQKIHQSLVKGGYFKEGLSLERVYVHGSTKQIIPDGAQRYANHTAQQLAEELVEIKYAISVPGASSIEEATVAQKVYGVWLRSIDHPFKSIDETGLLIADKKAVQKWVSDLGLEISQSKTLIPPVQKIRGGLSSGENPTDILFQKLGLDPARDNVELIFAPLEETAKKADAAAKKIGHWIRQHDGAYQDSKSLFLAKTDVLRNGAHDRWFITVRWKYDPKEKLWFAGHSKIPGALVKVADEEMEIFRRLAFNQQDIARSSVVDSWQAIEKIHLGINPDQSVLQVYQDILGMQELGGGARGEFQNFLRYLAYNRPDSPVAGPVGALGRVLHGAEQTLAKVGGKVKIGIVHDVPAQHQNLVDMRAVYETRTGFELLVRELEHKSSVDKSIEGLTDAIRDSYQTWKSKWASKVKSTGATDPHEVYPPPLQLKPPRPPLQLPPPSPAAP